MLVSRHGLENKILVSFSVFVSKVGLGLDLGPENLVFVLVCISKVCSLGAGVIISKSATARDIKNMSRALQNGNALTSTFCPLCSGSSSLSGQSATSPCWWCCFGAGADHRSAPGYLSDLWRSPTLE